MWAYCEECAQWYGCVRRTDGRIADWGCPVCGLPPVQVTQQPPAVGDVEPVTV